MSEDTRDRIKRRVEQVERAYAGHGRAFHVAWSLAAVIVLLAGIALMVLPGPAIVVIPVGLAMLAAQFGWARRLLAASIDRGADAEARLHDAGAKRKMLLGAAAACLGAAVAALLLLS